MCDVPVFFATSEGQTRRIAEALAGTLRELGLSSDAIDVSSPAARTLEWGAVRAAIVAASIHMGKHQQAAEAFVRAHLAGLATRPTVFISVSLAICSKNPEDAAKARAIAQAFPARLCWRPTRVECVAGRLAYRQYGFLTRWMMKRIAAAEGGPTDTSRNHDMTDWAAVRQIATEVATLARPAVKVRVAAAAGW
jgi:menaquinone-dependent protoporphyrinogen oxidase